MEENGGKRLIQNCIGYLNGTLKTDRGDNRALYPVITVFFGRQPVEHFPTVRDVFNINWKQDIDYLKYLNIVKSENGFVCSNLVTGASTDENPYDFVEKAVVEMQGEEHAFGDKTRTRFEYILAGEDEDGKDYYDFMINMKLGSHYNIFKTMFIMMDEREADKRQRIRELLSYITENRERTKNELGTVFLLSNYLKDGNILLDHRIHLNYRLVADLILLGGNLSANKSNNAVTSIENYNTIKTASYALVEKPVRGISIISLQKMMRYLIEENEKNYRNSYGDVLQAAEKIQDKLGIQRGRIQCLEEIFRDSILKIFPSPAEIKYLAYISEQEYKNINKEKRVSFPKLDRATGGNWSLFMEENYTGKLDGLLADERFMSDCLNRIEKDWRSVLSYEEALYGLEDDRVKESMEEFAVAPSAPAGNSMEENVHFQAVEETRKRFYSHMTKLLADILAGIHADAKKLKDSYMELEDEVGRAVIDDSEKSIRSYYEHLAENFLRHEGALISEDIFKLKNDEDKIVRALENAFKRLLLSDHIYAMSFEKELQTRLNTMSDVDRVLMIKGVLEEKIENKVRLHGRNNDYENNVRGIYYLMKEDAEYAQELGSNGSQFIIFHLNRTDCIEKIAIYDLDIPGQNQYCNLIEMVGEA